MALDDILKRGQFQDWSVPDHKARSKIQSLRRSALRLEQCRIDLCTLGGVKARAKLLWQFEPPSRVWQNRSYIDRVGRDRSLRGCRRPRGAKPRAKQQRKDAVQELCSRQPSERKAKRAAAQESDQVDGTAEGKAESKWQTRKNNRDGWGNWKWEEQERGSGLPFARRVRGSFPGEGRLTRPATGDVIGRGPQITPVSAGLVLAVLCRSLRPPSPQPGAFSLYGSWCAGPRNVNVGCSKGGAA